MILLFDESVHGAVYRWIRGEHPNVRAELSKDRLGPSTPDDGVADLADALRAVVVNSNPDDFKKLICRRPPTGRQPRRFAGRISFRCGPHREAARFESLLNVVIREWRWHQRQTDKRLIMDIHDDWYRVDR